MEEILQTLATAPSELIGQYIGFLRYAVPVMTFLLLLRCAFPLLTFRREPEIWAWLNLTDGTQIPITHWENVIGRSKSCDVTIDFSTISRNHAVLTRYDDGSWTLLDIGSKTGTFVNDRPIQICALKPKDRISIGGVEMQLQPITQRQEVRQAQLRTKAASGWDSVTNLMLLTILQCAILLGYLLRGEKVDFPNILIGFGGIVLSQWVLYLFYCLIHRKSFEVETIAFFLCTMGMAAGCHGTGHRHLPDSGLVPAGFGASQGGALSGGGGRDWLSGRHFALWHGILRREKLADSGGDVLTALGAE